MIFSRFLSTGLFRERTGQIQNEEHDLAKSIEMAMKKVPYTRLRFSKKLQLKPKTQNSGRCLARLEVVHIVRQKSGQALKQSRWDFYDAINI